MCVCVCVDLFLNGRVFDVQQYTLGLALQDICREVVKSKKELFWFALFKYFRKGYPPIFSFPPSISVVPGSTSLLFSSVVSLFSRCMSFALSLFLSLT